VTAYLFDGLKPRRLRRKQKKLSAWERNSTKQRAYYKRWYAEQRSDPEAWERYKQDRRQKDHAKRKNLRTNPEELALFRLKRRASKYGVTVDVLREMDARPTCELCGELFQDGSGKAMCRVTDHNHTSGALRGSIHLRCNLVLGLIEQASSPFDLLKAIHHYLERHTGGISFSEHDLQETTGEGTATRPRNELRNIS
jgi:hypothetical protein